MVTYITRPGWTSRARPTTLAPLAGSDLKGIALHWTGSEAPLGATATLPQSARRLEAYRRLHTAPEPKGRGWSDIAYSVAIDAAGRVFDLRGIEHRSAANGDAAVNRSHGAVLLLLGRGDTPTLAMLDALTAWRRVIWLKRWPAATGVVGHRDLHDTECPGHAAYAVVTSGRLTSSAPVLEDPMALSDDDVERIARRTSLHVVDRLMAAPGAKTDTGQTAEYVVVAPDGRRMAVTDALTELLRLAGR